MCGPPQEVVGAKSKLVFDSDSDSEDEEYGYRLSGLLMLDGAEPPSPPSATAAPGAGAGAGAGAFQTVAAMAGDKAVVEDDKVKGNDKGKRKAAANANGGTASPNSPVVASAAAGKAGGKDGNAANAFELADRHIAALDASSDALRGEAARACARFAAAATRVRAAAPSLPFAEFYAPGGERSVPGDGSGGGASQGGAGRGADGVGAAVDTDANGRGGALPEAVAARHVELQQGRKARRAFFLFECE